MCATTCDCACLCAGTCYRSRPLACPGAPESSGRPTSGPIPVGVRESVLRRAGRRGLGRRPDHTTPTSGGSPRDPFADGRRVSENWGTPLSTILWWTPRTQSPRRSLGEGGVRGGTPLWIIQNRPRTFRLAQRQTCPEDFVCPRRLDSGDPEVRIVLPF